MSSDRLRASCDRVRMSSDQLRVSCDHVRMSSDRLRGISYRNLVICGRAIIFIKNNMRIFCILLLACCTAILSRAGGRDSLATTIETEGFRSSLLAAPLPNEREARLRKYVPEYKLQRKLRMANGMLFAGGACLVASVPVFILANNSYDKSQSSGTNRIDGGSQFLLTFGAVLLAGAGVGLTIPGAILHAKYKRQLEAK